MAAPSSRARDEFRFRRLEKPEEFRAVEEVERLAFGLRTDVPTSPALQRVLQDHGGLVVGAFSDIYLAGFALGFLGWDGTTLYHYSHTTAVRPEYQNHHLGFRLKAFQRDEVLRQGLGEMRWALDPLSSRGAMLTVRKLGAQLTGYKVHYLGQVDSDADEGTETDRLTVRWPLSDPRVEQRLGGVRPTREEDLARFRTSAAIIETDLGETGLRVPTTVAEPTTDRAHLEIPFDIGLVRLHAKATLRTWRHAVRDAFRAAFDLDYVVEDFAVITSDHERRSVYLLAQRPTAGAPTAPPSATP
ncbi:MAG: GNAT family N-acetyltransferase [Thermoplasmata archaeon]|nr:GNAT family N-acetyltransferase [Thermoplasmata archaeon]